MRKKLDVKNWDFKGPSERHKVTVTKNGQSIK